MNREGSSEDEKLVEELMNYVDYETKDDHHENTVSNK